MQKLENKIPFQMFPMKGIPSVLHEVKLAFPDQFYINPIQKYFYLFCNKSNCYSCKNFTAVTPVVLITCICILTLHLELILCYEKISSNNNDKKVFPGSWYELYIKWT